MTELDERSAWSPTMWTRVSLLCIVSGSLDAVTVLLLGEAFASVMTGNIVLMGVAAGTTDAWRALSCVAALLGYVSGGLIGSWWTRRGRREREPIWPARVTRTLAIELVLLVGAGVVWAIFSHAQNHVLPLSLLTAAAAAMGIQGAAVRAIGTPVSTTYMTGALTGLVEALALRTRFSATHRHGAVGLASLLAGALAGGVVVLFARPAALVVPVVALTLVIVISWVLRGRAARSGATQDA
jgi:uncharacterized membrane protein YoaK (UPF0700 family)